MNVENSNRCCCQNFSVHGFRMMFPRNFMFSVLRNVVVGPSFVFEIYMFASIQAQRLAATNVMLVAMRGWQYRSYESGFGLSTHTSIIQKSLRRGLGWLLPLCGTTHAHLASFTSHLHLVTFMREAQIGVLLHLDGYIRA